MRPEPPLPASPVHFTTEDVEAAAGNKKPWVRQEEFDTEINADDIAATAAAYGRAAGEARNAQDLAVRATEISQQGGGLDGTPLVDREARIDETRGGLQDGGADIDAVVGHLVYAMNLALATKDDVRGLIENPQGLNTKYIDHLNAAIAEWNGWVQALNDAIANQSDLLFGLQLGILTGGNPRRVPDPPPLSVDHPNGESRFAPLTASGYVLPEDLPGQIRDKYIRLAAIDAAATLDDIEAEIERYRRLMAERADELQRLGHDPSAGPLNLWGNGEGNDGQEAAGDPHEWATRDADVAADTIAAHAGDRSIPGVDDLDVPEYIENVMTNQPGYPMRATPSGTPRMAWWDPDTGTMIIREGNGGTFFQPDRGYEYFLEQVEE